jgi:hypothetical protein
VRAAAQRAVNLMAVLAEPGDVDQVAAVLRAHGETELGDLTAQGVREMQRAAVALHRVFAARDVDEAANLLNELLTRHAQPPRLTTHGGTSGWHLHVDGHDNGPWGEWLLTSSCWALASLLADRQELPGGLCASPPCRKPFVDFGGGSPQRYCSPRCATRERVAAHRRAKQEA